MSEASEEEVEYDNTDLPQSDVGSESDDDDDERVEWHLSREENPHPECSKPNNGPKRSPPWMTKYELKKLWSLRALQIR